jgi:hypothetical protein
MSKTPSKRVPAQVVADDTGLPRLATIEGYAPTTPSSSSKRSPPPSTSCADQAGLIRAQVALDAARDKLAHTEHRAHQKMLGVKDSVCSQYGDDSNEYAALGMKKKSERKKGGNKPRPPEA